MPGPWDNSDVPRGADYDRRFQDLASAGMDMHGEAALVASFSPRTVLDAGCGTGRVAIELNRRGHAVIGVDLDEAMLEQARAKAPDLAWVQADLADPGLDFGQSFDVIVMAGNVLIFVPPGSEQQVVENAARWLRPNGHLITGYALRPGGFGPHQHDTLAATAGLLLQDRWSTWDKVPFSPHDPYAVAVHRREI